MEGLLGPAGEWAKRQEGRRCPDKPTGRAPVDGGPLYLLWPTTDVLSSANTASRAKVDV